MMDVLTKLSNGEKCAVKITPAHDQNDFEAGQRHSLKVLQVIDESGNITSICEEFQGSPRFKVRELIRSRLQDMGLFRGAEDHKMLVPVCSRSRDIVELLVRPQWFIKCEEMASKALEAVKEGKLTIQPRVFENNWNNWLENIRDWCISRQLWWGHQIPAYCCSLKNDPNKQIWVAAKNENEAKLKAVQQIGFEDENLIIIRDEDVLDTWFSSSLLPFSAFGWPQQNEELSKYYPLSIMETGHDILFFWVARMAMIGKQLTGELPFQNVLLHGIICDTNGRKMSKSLGNIVAPGDVINGISLECMEKRAKDSHATGILSQDELKRSIEGQKKMFPLGIPECGSDALRFTLVAQDNKNHYISFDVSECHTNRLFCNKIWQATKFSNMWFTTVSEKQKIPTITDDQLSVMDKWILSRLSKLVNTANAALQSHDFHIAVNGLKTFLYYDFCDIYLESTKRWLRVSDSKEAAAHCWVLLKCLDIGLRTLAPFMPMLSEHLHKSLPINGVEMKNIDYPQNLPWVDNELEQNIEETLEIIVALRRLRKIFNLTPKHKPEAYLTTTWPFLEKISDVIADLAGCYRIYISDTFDENMLKSCIKDSVRRTKILLNIPEEFRNKMEFNIPVMQKKKEKLINELEKLRKMISGKTYREKATISAQNEHSNRMLKIQEKITRIEYISKLIES